MYIIVLFIFFVHFEFGLVWYYIVKIVLRFRFWCLVCGVGGVIYSVGLFFYYFEGGGSVAVQSNVLTSALSTLSTSAGNAVSDLSSVSAGADVLASQFADVKVALQNLQSLATTMSASGFYVPVGSLMPFAASTAPDGWYLCNGATWASLSLSAGSPLYDLLQPLGYAGVPDLRGRTIIGVGVGADASPVTGVIGVPQGAATVTLTSAQSGLPAHAHSVTNFPTVDGAGNHSHGGATVGAGVTGNFTAGQDPADIGSSSNGVIAIGNYQNTSYNKAVSNANHAHTINADGAHNHTIPDHNTNNNTAANAASAHTNIQPSLALNYIIKS